PKMLQLAGEIADGVILTGASSPKYIQEFAIKHLKTGAERGGRDLRELDVCCNIISSCDNDSMQAKQLTKSMVGLCLSAPEYGSLMMRESGLDDTPLIPIRRCLAQGDTASMQRYVTDEMVEQFTISGNFEECRQKLREYIQAGVDTPIFWLLGNFQQTLQKLSKILA
ncbi:MAG: LLM class flavin-dependent oxidoreductase, partial [Candidatus Bathyarchaeota archaeon]